MTTGEVLQSLRRSGEPELVAALEAWAQEFGRPLRIVKLPVFGGDKKACQDVQGLGVFGFGFHRLGQLIARVRGHRGHSEP